MTTYFKTIVAVLVPASIPQFAFAADVEVPAEIQAVMSEYEPKLEALQTQLQEETPPNPNEFEYTLNVECTTGEVKVNLPQFNMKREEIKLDIPEFFTEEHVIKTKVPEFRKGCTRVAGVKVCNIPKWYTKTIKTKVKTPSVRMERQSWKFDLPEVSWESTTIDYPRCAKVSSQLDSYERNTSQIATDIERLAAEYEQAVYEAAEAYATSQLQKATAQLKLAK